MEQEEQILRHVAHHPLLCGGFSSHCVHPTQRLSPSYDGPQVCLHEHEYVPVPVHFGDDRWADPHPPVHRLASHHDLPGDLCKNLVRYEAAADLRLGRLHPHDLARLPHARPRLHRH